MKLKMTPILLVILLFSCRMENGSKEVFIEANKPLTQHHKSINPEMAKTIVDRIKVPDNYKRTDWASDSFESYLRNLRLKPENSIVKYYNGKEKSNNGIYEAVVDLPIGKKDLHQCADAVMRLRAEYLWEEEYFDKIHFNFTNGYTVNYTEWMKGKRMVVQGNKTFWNDRSKPSNTYQDFWNYMELIFMYAGTASLEKELESININTAKIGDVLIQGGHPGHAVIIVDEAINVETQEKVFLLAQSYMPAQEIQILQNPDRNISPWYRLKEGKIETPEWTFTDENIRRFNE